MIASRLEKAKNVNTEIQALISDTVKKHGRIIFDGNNYSEEWLKEAEKRGLPNVRNTVDAYKSFISAKAIKLFDKYKVLSKEELHSRYDIYTEQYSKHINIEAQTAMQMVRRLFIPAIIRFTTELGNSVNAAGKYAVVQKDLLAKVSKLLASIAKKLDNVEKQTSLAQGITDVSKQGAAFRDKVAVALADLRADIDTLEKITPRDLWPVPVYSDLLFKL